MDRSFVRQVSVVRGKVEADDMADSIKSNCSTDWGKFLMDNLSSTTGMMDSTSDRCHVAIPVGAKSHSSEVDVFMGLVALVYLVDKKVLDNGCTVADKLVEKTSSLHGMDALVNKCYYYYARVYELSGKLGAVRSVLLKLYRSATVHHSSSQQAVLINLVLRSYYLEGMVDQAQKFSSKVSFPETRSNAEYARYLFYMGCIRAIQLQYSEAHSYLMQAMRKAPQTGAKGFRLAVIKTGVIVELLMGDIPERSRFREFKAQLLPYFNITNAVRLGDVNRFAEVVAKNETRFVTDRLLSLINRLHQNVIKAGLRAITTTYSRIALSDVAAKLSLSSVEEAIDVIAKAIMDGVIDAKINYEQGCVESGWGGDIYSTTEPSKQLHKRIAFCLQLHTDTVRAMQYPDVNELEKELAATKEEILKSQKIDLEDALNEDDDDMML